MPEPIPPSYPPGGGPPVNASVPGNPIEAPKKNWFANFWDGFRFIFRKNK